MKAPVVTWRAGNIPSIESRSSPAVHTPGCIHAPSVATLSGPSRTPPHLAGTLRRRLSPPHMMRSIWAVVVGFFFTAVMSIGADAIMRAMSPSLFKVDGSTSSVAILWLSTISIAVFAVVGCYITARLAPSHPLRHAVILGAVALVGSLILLPKTWPMAPAWYNILNLVV